MSKYYRLVILSTIVLCGFSFTKDPQATDPPDASDLIPIIRESPLNLNTICHYVHTRICINHRCFINVECVI